jgi:hypothetical protein
MSHLPDIDKVARALTLTTCYHVAGGCLLEVLRSTEGKEEVDVTTMMYISTQVADGMAGGRPRSALLFPAFGCDGSSGVGNLLSLLAAVRDSSDQRSGDQRTSLKPKMHVFTSNPALTAWRHQRLRGFVVSTSPLQAYLEEHNFIHRDLAASSWTHSQFAITRVYACV